jgi:hypothetical protein
MKPAPLALFAFNRPTHVQRTLAALVRNELAAQTDLIVFCDGPRGGQDAESVRLVRDQVRAVEGFRSVKLVEQGENLGLAASIIRGVSAVCAEHGRVIVVEDDLVTSPFFLRYMNEGLDLYAQVEEVISLHGYVYPVNGPLPETFLLRGADCWGWATWQRGWALFNPDGRQLLAELEQRKLTGDFDFGGVSGHTAMLRDQIAGRNNSWAVRWYASAFLRGKLTLYPGCSLVQNIGHDSSGAHCGDTVRYDGKLADKPVTMRRLEPTENQEARKAFSDFFRGPQRPTSRLATLTNLFKRPT